MRKTKQPRYPSGPCKNYGRGIHRVSCFKRPCAFLKHCRDSVYAEDPKALAVFEDDMEQLPQKNGWQMIPGEEAPKQVGREIPDGLLAEIRYMFRLFATAMDSNPLTTAVAVHRIAGLSYEQIGRKFNIARPSVLFFLDKTQGANPALCRYLRSNRDQLNDGQTKNLVTGEMSGKMHELYDIMSQNRTVIKSIDRPGTGYRKDSDGKTAGDNSNPAPTQQEAR